MLLVKTVLQMTTEEFAQELVRLRRETLTVVREVGRAKNGRYGDNMKRGKKIVPLKYVESKWSRMG